VSERDKWEARYASRAEEQAAAPSRLLVEHRHLLPAGRALDVACGDGRNALWLARQGYAVDAIDIAFAGLARLAAAAQREGLVVRPIQANLEEIPLPRDRYAVVVNCRYLQRTLFPALRGAVRPGGVIVFETFLREQARIGHPRNPAFLLEPGELRAEFATFSVLVDAEGCVETDGAASYLARLIARRRDTGTLD
jgi:2-polyprenyl-3-methyl-5-hydroxy-6-metoxy-1,4-benzoquinol methylase